MLTAVCMYPGRALTGRYELGLVGMSLLRIEVVTALMSSALSVATCLFMVERDTSTLVFE